MVLRFLYFGNGWTAWSVLRPRCRSVLHECLPMPAIEPQDPGRPARSSHHIPSGSGIQNYVIPNKILWVYQRCQLVKDDRRFKDRR